MKNKKNKKNKNNRYTKAERIAQEYQRNKDKLLAKKEALLLSRKTDLGNFLSTIAGGLVTAGFIGYSMQSMDFYFAIPSIYIGCCFQLLSFYVKSK